MSSHHDEAVDDFIAKAGARLTDAFNEMAEAVDAAASRFLERTGIDLAGAIRDLTITGAVNVDDHLYPKTATKGTVHGGGTTPTTPPPKNRAPR